MRVKAPPPFSLTMIGPEGQYTLQYAPEPEDEWSGRINVAFSDETTLWMVHRVDDDGDGRVLGGMAGINSWNESFWFSLCLDAQPRRIEYWGNQAIWRVDHEPVSLGKIPENT